MKPLLFAFLFLLLPFAVWAAEVSTLGLQEYTYCGCCPCCPDASMDDVKNTCLSHRKGESLDLLVQNLKAHCKASKEACTRNAGKSGQCSQPRRHYKYCDSPWPPVFFDPRPDAPRHSN